MREEPKKYLPYIQHLDLSEEEKSKLLEELYFVAETLVDLSLEGKGPDDAAKTEEGYGDRT